MGYVRSYRYSVSHIMASYVASYAHYFSYSYIADPLYNIYIAIIFYVPSLCTSVPPYFISLIISIPTVLFYFTILTLRNVIAYNYSKL